MSNTTKVAKRYAQGLLDFTTETGNTETVFNEMKDVAETISGSKELRSFFATPIIDYRRKQSVASEIFSKFSVVTKNMITLVIKQGRERYLEDIAKEYVEKVEEMNGVQKVTLTTAEALSQQSLDQIVKTSSLIDVNKKYKIKSIIKPELIGGYILRVGDQQIDNSVRTHLANLRKEFQLN